MAESSLTDDQVIDGIKKMAYEYKVFARAEQIMQHLVEAKKLEAEMEARKETLLGDLKHLVEEKTEAEMAQTKLNQEIKRARDEADQAMTRVNQEMTELQNKKQQAQAEFDEFRKKLDEQIAEHQAKAKEVYNRRVEAEKALMQWKSEHGL